MNMISVQGILLIMIQLAMQRGQKKFTGKLEGERKKEKGT